MKLGIIAAMASEIAYVLSQCEVVNQINLKKNTFYLCEYEDYELIVVASGVGKTNATMYTQVLIDFFEPLAVINIGIGGALSEELKPCDVILGTSFSHHDVTIEQMENLSPFTSLFHGDKQLITQFSPVIAKKKQGKVVSGESFIATSNERLDIIQKHQPLMVDMETSSIAHCCYLNEMPFISLRSVSDLADETADDSYEKNEVNAADSAGKKLLEALKRGIH